MVIRQQTGPWCMPHSLREIQSALRLCETRVNHHQDNDRTSVVTAPILLLPYVKNCVCCDRGACHIADLWDGARETLENGQFSSWRSRKKLARTPEKQEPT